ncbi:MAG: type II toxin-antitoxin system HicB family antitoxin [Deltaproteobacteria bacterium]|nr:type II toxin-antitoxin system HicB family antitoxin [Deltaproteobacteria bacterium]
METRFVQYRVCITRDAETGQIVAEIPVLGIADYGNDLPEALTRLEEMVRFHLECLQEEGKAIPEEQVAEEGFYVHVKLPAHAA